MSQGAAIFAATMFTNLAMFAYHVALSRSLGVERYGVLYTLVSAATFIAVIASILTIVIARLLAEAAVKTNRDLLRSLVGSSLRRGTLAGVAASVVLLAIALPMASFLHLQTPAAVFALVVFAGTQFVLAAARGVLQGLQKFFPLAWSLVVEAFLRTALAIWLTWLGHGVTYAVGAYALGSLIAMVYTVWYVVRIIPPSRERTGLAKTGILRLSSGAAISTLAIAALGILDVVLVRHYFDNLTSSIYSAVSLAGKLVYLAAGFLPTLLLPKATATAFEGGKSWRILLPAGAAMAIMSGVTLILFWLVPGQLIRAVTGPQYAGAAQYIFRYAIAMTFLGATNALIAYRIALSDFSFIPGAVFAVVLQGVCIALFHNSIDQVILIVIGTNAAAFAAVAFGLPGRLRSGSGVMQIDPMLIAEELESI